MLRACIRLAAVCAPLAAFVWWLQGPVMEKMTRQGLMGILYMLAGVALLALIEGLLFKFWLLPQIAQAVSERLYAGSYFPEDDPLARLVAEISEHHRRELLPELQRLVEADPQRERGWLELARLQEAETSSPEQAVHTLLRGAEILRRREDAAMLLWRAYTLCKRYPERAEQAEEILRELTSRYPDTGYGRRAERPSA